MIVQIEIPRGESEFTVGAALYLLEALVQLNLDIMARQDVPAMYHTNVHYRPEPPGPEKFDNCLQVIKRGWGDCFPEGTKLLDGTYQLRAIESLVPGDKIWGLNEWSTVEAVQFKGLLDVDAVYLNNGSMLPLTKNHHVFALECPIHGHSEGLSKPCSCPASTRREVKVRVSDLRKSMVLIAPERIAFGQSDLSPEKAYVEGLFVSDGWSDKASRFSISGQDGSPKEAQKKEVQRICERLGLNTRMARKYISVNDRDWALRMQLMGHSAPNKHLLSLNLDEASAIATLRGIMADSGKNTSGGGRTFTTTSHHLAVQCRVLHRMVGMSASYRYVPNHGGLGTHAVHRLGIRDRDASKREKLLRVQSIEPKAFQAPCWDIQTNDHRVYLPEHDITVSNCDDLAAWRVAELRKGGEADAKCKVVWIKGRRNYHAVVERADGSMEDPCQTMIRKEKSGGKL